ncbi:MAG: hypothetical protein U1F22_10795 [Lysobacterales bacterium]
MSLRRIIAFLVLALDAYIVLRVAPAIGMLGPVFQLIGVFVGIGALSVLVFNLPVTKRRISRRQIGHREKSWAETSRLQRTATLALIVVLAIGPLVIAARGVYLGALPSFVRPRGPDVVFSQTPGNFLLNLIAYVVFSLVFLIPLLRARSASRNASNTVARDGKV